MVSYYQQSSLRIAQETNSARQAGKILSKYGASLGGIARMKKYNAEKTKNKSGDVRRATGSKRLSRI